MARGLRGRVLLLDHHEVGSHQTSARGTPLWVLARLGVERSAIQVHDRAVIQTPTRTVIYDASESPYCTFDYARFCRDLREQSEARFLRTAVRGLGAAGVETDAGRFEAPCVIDASGWHRVLVAGAGPPVTAPPPLIFGLETESDYAGEGLYFWIDPDILREGAAWLERFLGRLALAPSRYHGTYFPAGLGEPTVGRVFAVGDAAGQCLPLTGEGIRWWPRYLGFGRGPDGPGAAGPLTECRRLPAPAAGFDRKSRGEPGPGPGGDGRAGCNPAPRRRSGPRRGLVRSLHTLGGYENETRWRR